MNLYLVEFYILLFNVLLSHGFGNEGKKNLFILSCGQLILITILRSSFDSNWPDTINYINTFNYIKNTFSWKQCFNNSWEPGIVLLVKIIGSFFDNNQAYIIIFGILILIPVFLMIWRYSASPMLGLFIFYAMGNLMTTSIYRQWLAIAILTFSLKYIFERNLFKFLVMIILACVFHRTAIIFTIAYFLYNIKVSKKNLFISVFISFLIYLLGDKVLSFLNLFSRMKGVSENNGGFTFWIILWVSILLAYCLCKNLINDPRFKVFFNIVLVGAVLQPISFTFSLWYRAVLYFSLFLVILIPKVFENIFSISENNRKLRVIIEPLFLFIMLGWFYVGSFLEYIPFWHY